MIIEFTYPHKIGVEATFTGGIEIKRHKKDLFNN